MLKEFKVKYRQMKKELEELNRIYPKISNITKKKFYRLVDQVDALWENRRVK